MPRIYPMKNLRISFTATWRVKIIRARLTVTQHTINTSPPFLRLMGTPTSIPNDTWLQGHSFLSTVAKYSNDLPQAEMTARELAYNAPGNQGLRIDYASVLQARGWPRAAENELKKQK